jgi:hypothetical protein
MEKSGLVRIINLSKNINIPQESLSLMEQYWMPKELDFDNLGLCLDNYRAERLHIRRIGPQGGTSVVNESLEGRTLDFARDKDWIHLLIDDDEVFKFTLKSHNNEYANGFSLAYERFEKIEHGERLIMLSKGVDPYDHNLPEPRRSILRHELDQHTLEIYFKGRVHLKFHSLWPELQRKYWTVTDTPTHYR